MATRREQLNDILSAIPGVAKVYYNPPTNVTMAYPCIRYTLAADTAEHANNRMYKHMKRYTLTVIDKKPTSIIPDAVREIPYCVFDRSYVADGLHHFVFSIYF